MYKYRAHTVQSISFEIYVIWETIGSESSTNYAQWPYVSATGTTEFTS